jgi:hypothetical protein
MAVETSRKVEGPEAPALVSAFELHINDKPTETIEIFPVHNDKVGNVVLFHGLEGRSFIFVELPEGCVHDGLATDEVHKMEGHFRNQS